MAACKSTRVNRKNKTKYRVTNWREYERGFRSRGDITVWLSDGRAKRGHHRTTAAAVASRATRIWQS